MLGELLLTAGVLVMLFVAWQMWIGDIIIGAQQNSEGAAVTAEWENEPPPEPPPVVETEDGETWYEPPLLEHPGAGEYLAQMRIPRFGDDYAVPMAGGVTRARTLDTIGIGHYPGTSMPGEPGNFALAAHRTTFGAPFNRIAELRVGDAIVVETQEGWYTYRFRTLQYVRPDEVEVLLPVPQAMDVPAGTAYITLTSCSPKLSMTERIVAYGVFESFTPRSAGQLPPSLQAVA